MNVRLNRNPLLVLAICTLSGSFALSQQTPPAPAPAPAPAAAPIQRQPPANPGMRPGMMQGRMRTGTQGRFHANMNRNRGNFHGGMAGGFRGSQGGPMGGDFHIGPGGMWWKSPMVVQRLSLTADQTKKMDDIFQQSRIQLIDLRADVQKQEVMLEPLLSASTLDSAKAMAQIDKVADARANLEKADAKMLLGIRGVLTPDQWTKLRSRGFGEPGGGPGGPAGAGGPGGGGPGGGGGRGMRGGGPPPNTSNLIDPIDQP